MSRDSGLLVNLSFLLDQPTGISTYAANVAPHLSSLSTTFLSPFQLPGGGQYYRTPRSLTPAFGTAGHLRRLFWTQFCLPHIYRELKSSLLFSLIPEAPLFTSCRSVVMIHDLIPLRFTRRSPLLPYFHYYIPQVTNCAEHLICNSEATARDVVEWFGISARKVTVIWLGVDLERFHPMASQTENYFLYVGRHDPHKNLARAIRAFAQISGQNNHEFWLAGPTDRRYTPQLKMLANELGVGKQVRFLDYVSDAELPRIMACALAVVFPSLWEGFGLPVLEAMACGTPTIASNLSSIPEVAGDAALLVDPYDVFGLAGAMQDIVNDPNLRLQLREAGLSRVKQFSWMRTGQRTAEVLRSLL